MDKKLINTVWQYGYSSKEEKMEIVHWAVGYLKDNTIEEAEKLLPLDPGPSAPSREFLGAYKEARTKILGILCVYWG